MSPCLQLKQITHTTKWVDAQAIFSAHEAFQTDLALQQTDPIDLLIAYEDHILKLEREYEAARAMERASAKRAERRNRDAFKVRLTAAAVQAWPGKPLLTISEQRFYPSGNRRCWTSAWPLAT